MELEVGQRVWVRSSLEDGAFVERRIEDITVNFGGKEVIFLEKNALAREFFRNDLVYDEKEAQEIYLGALRSFARVLEEKISRALSKNTFGRPKMAWETD